MKKNIVLLTGILIFSISVQYVQAQVKPVKGVNKQIVPNPNADRDVNLFSKFTYALQTNDLATARTLMTSNALSYGPSAKDSASVDSLMAIWKERLAGETDVQMSYIPSSFRVLSGALKGDWAF